jgi:hypothetical protein
MRLFIIAAAAAMLLAPEALAAGGTGVGKGSPTTTPTTEPTQSTTNPCNPGDTYDASKNLCTSADGSTYTPKPQ